jgi:glycosyltransferase involved in cell wall biosynthesis
LDGLRCHDVKVCFVVSDLRPSGGVDVILQYAEALSEDHGLHVDLVGSGPAVLESSTHVARPVLDPDSAGVVYDIAISTWWETAHVMWRLPARRRLAFVQSSEECFYRRDQALERLGAVLALRAADGYIAVSSWLAALTNELRPGARVELVPNGVDKNVFDGRRVERGGGPLRVLVEGQPTVWFKGVDDTLRALADVAEPVEVTLVCRDPEQATGVEADRVVGGLDAAAMADLYASTDVLVKLSRLEGLGLAPLEAFHHGVPCIVTPYGGHEDYVRHGENGLLVGFDDLPTVTRAVERLAQDRDLLDRLGRGALETAASWPTTASSADQFATALRGFEEEEPGPPLEALLEAWRVVAEQGRPSRGALAWHEAELAKAHAAITELVDDVRRLNELVAELEASRKDVNRLLLEREAELEAATSSRAYRAAVAARSLVDKVRR